MKTKISAEEKETGLIIDKLYQALKEVLELTIDCLWEWDQYYALLKEVEEKYSMDSKPSED